MARYTPEKALITKECEDRNRKLINQHKAPAQEDGTLFRAILAGDMHTDGDKWRDRNNNIRDILTGYSIYNRRVDAVITAGDITNSGEWEEYENLYEMMKDFYTLTAPFVVSMGNHDSQSVNINLNYERGKENFRKFNEILGNKIHENYFSMNINGQEIVCLGTENIVNNDNAYLSEKQLDFVRTEIEKAAKEKLPLIIICHQPLAGSHGFTHEKNPKEIVGKQNDELYEILKNGEKNGAHIIYVSGHTHCVFSENSIDVKSNNLVFVNVPSVLYNFGDCVVLEIYKDKIKLFSENVINNSDTLAIEKEIIL